MSTRSRLVVALFALSCSKSVELSRSPELRPSTDPTVLAGIGEEVGAMAVDNVRLYWSGSQGSNALGASALRSCNKQHCLDSLVTYDPDGASTNTNFGVIDGQIYWLHLLASEPAVWEIRACDAAGCGNAPRTVGRGILDFPSTVTFSANTVFIGNGNTISSVPLSATAADPKFVLQARSAFYLLSAQEPYLYWISQGDYGRGVVLERARTDGTGALEVLAENLEVIFNGGPFPQSGLALDASYVYWSQGTLAGSIARCPLAGCNGAPEVVVTPVRSPTTLALDGQRLYWQHDTATQGLAVSDCALGDCAGTTPIVVGLDATNALTVDDRYLYTATTDAPIPVDGWPNPNANIRRIPK